MDVTTEDFRRHYQDLSDEALLEIDTSELTEVARTCLEEELGRRGYEAVEDDEDSPDASHPEGAAPEELVCIVEYDYMDEADLARGLLEAAEIPASLQSEPGVVRLMVPAGFAEDALRMLTAPLSDEELAAQAEAAGHPEEEADEASPDEDTEEDPKA